MSFASLMRRRHLIAIAGVSVSVVLIFTLALHRGREVRPGIQSLYEDGAEQCSSIRTAHSDNAAAFSEILGLAVDSRGQVYVAGDPFQITVLSDAGEVVGTIGRKGEGPGEFTGIANVQILSGDTLMVYDKGTGRITMLTPDSLAPNAWMVVETINLSQASSLPVPNWVAKVAGYDGFVSASVDFVSVDSDPASDYSRNWTINLLNADGTLRRRSILSLPGPQNSLIARASIEGERIIISAPNPFGRPGKVQVGPDGHIYYGFGDSLSISIYALDGKRVGGFSKPYRAHPIVKQEVDRFLLSSDPSDPVAVLIRGAIEEYINEYANGRWPVFQTYVIDDRGNIWIGFTGGEVDGENLLRTTYPREWAIIDVTGTVICTIRFADPTYVWAVQSEKVYGMVTDSLGVPSVVVYRAEGL